MALVGALATGEDLLVCDLAQVYGIHDMAAFRPVYIGTLVDGLPDTSRIKLAKAGLATSIDRILLAHAADKLANVVWMLSDDGRKGVNPPMFFLPVLLGQEKGEAQGYDSPAAFFEAMEKYEVAK